MPVGTLGTVKGIFVEDLIKTNITNYFWKYIPSYVTTWYGSN